MPIKNYTTKVPAVQTVGEIQGILAAHGARKVMMDYSENGRVEAVTFGLLVNGTMAGFRVDAKPQGVARVMVKDRVKCDEDQAERIAWRNVKDWISAQIALVETEQATMEEVFLPYLLDRQDKTLYQKLLDGQLLLAAGESDEKERNLSI